MGRGCSFGTVIASGAIAVANVLLPALIKRDFPKHSGAMMGVYTMAISGFAAVAAASTVPLGDLIGYGWRGALGVWGDSRRCRVASLDAVCQRTYASRGNYADREFAAASCPHLGAHRLFRAAVIVVLFGAFVASIDLSRSWVQPGGGRSGAFSGDVCPNSRQPAGAQVRSTRSRPAPIHHDQYHADCSGSGWRADRPNDYALFVGDDHWCRSREFLRHRSPTFRSSRQDRIRHGAAVGHGADIQLPPAATGPLLLGAVHDATGSWSPPLALLLVLVSSHSSWSASSPAGRSNLAAAKP